MADYLDQLVRLLPPPPTPVAGLPWERSRQHVGFDFPQDYQAFVDLYGGGHIGAADGLRMFIYAPTSASRIRTTSTGFKGFVDWHVAEMAPMFEGTDADHWGGTLYPVYPEPGGLLTWGENEQGDMFWWLTEGDDADKWPVVMWARGPATTFRFECGMTGLLHALLVGSAPGPEWLRTPETHWTMTSDWQRTGLDVSCLRSTPHPT
ncbi:SMI1/KNR4 family protein [Peterkaempfera griseoplana]|uniref:hypothetical protein n=1 Tax=Peterkaempfera griseoplana TaxID=66896 RepID=UPI0006E43DBF|nr:hypothetical protein [Peterkaempfera griseoplana]